MTALPGVNAAASYGWDGNETSMLTNALYNWQYTVAPVNIAFIEWQTFNGSGFPWSKWDHAFVSESGPTYAPGPEQSPGPYPTGKRITEFTVAPNGSSSGPTTFLRYAGNGMATVAGLAAGPDGLYFTDLYKDNGTAATDRGASVWRIRVH